MLTQACLVIAEPILSRMLKQRGGKFLSRNVSGEYLSGTMFQNKLYVLGRRIVLHFTSDIAKSNASRVKLLWTVDKVNSTRQVGKSEICFVIRYGHYLQYSLNTLFIVPQGRSIVIFLILVKSNIVIIPL